MNTSLPSRKCKKHRLKITWLCVAKGCKQILFCKKCRKEHNKRHEDFYYPIHELMEEDNEILTEQIELNEDEKKKIYHKIDKEIDNSIECFIRDMELARAQLKQRVDEQKLNVSAQNVDTVLAEHRQKVLYNPHNDMNLLRLGQEYHKFLQESQIQTPEKRKLLGIMKDDIDHRFDHYYSDIENLNKKLLSKGKYPTDQSSELFIQKSISNKNPNDSGVKISHLDDWNRQNGNVQQVAESLPVFVEPEQKKVDQEVEEYYFFIIFI